MRGSLIYVLVSSWSICRVYTMSALRFPPQTTTATAPMPLPATTSLWLLVCFLAPPTNSLNNVTSLTGTWSSKSNTVFTGPVSHFPAYHRLKYTNLSQDFYDPVIEDMKEPRLTGTSFSFTDDGYFEEALYLVISNRKLALHHIIQKTYGCRSP